LRRTEGKHLALQAEDLTKTGRNDLGEPSWAGARTIDPSGITHFRKPSTVGFDFQCVKFEAGTYEMERKIGEREREEGKAL